MPLANEFVGTLVFKNWAEHRRLQKKSADINTGAWMLWAEDAEQGDEIDRYRNAKLSISRWPYPGSWAPGRYVLKARERLFSEGRVHPDHLHKITMS